MVKMNNAVGLVKILKRHAGNQITLHVCLTCLTIDRQTYQSDPRIHQDQQCRMVILDTGQVASSDLTSILTYHT